MMKRVNFCLNLNVSKKIILKFLEWEDGATNHVKEDFIG
jgi:hypothetical protein